MNKQISMIPEPDDEVYRVLPGGNMEEEAEYYTSSDAIVSKFGCNAGVKALRKCFETLLIDHTDNRFTGRLMKIVAMIWNREKESFGPVKQLLFSQHRNILYEIEFNIRKRNTSYLSKQLITSHDDSRAVALITAKKLHIFESMIPQAATHFRILNHLSVVSDYRFSKRHHRYEPVSMLNGMSVCGYSDYYQVVDHPDFEIRVELPDGICPLEEDTMIQCMGLEFLKKSGHGYYLLNSGGGVVISDVF